MFWGGICRTNPEVALPIMSDVEAMNGDGRIRAVHNTEQFAVPDLTRAFEAIASRGSVGKVTVEWDRARL